MRKLSVMVLTFVMIMAIGSLATAQEATWFDLENCEMCKPMMETEGFMQNVQWETYPIANGSIDITTVKKGFEAKYKATHSAMMANFEKLQGGAEMKMCGMCSAFSSCMDETVKIETVSSNNSEITLYTSTNAETAAKLQGIAKRNIEEMKKMMAAQKAPTGHEGHNH